MSVRSPARTRLNVCSQLHNRHAAVSVTCVKLPPFAWRYYRQDAAKRQTAGIKFTHRPKIRFFAPQGRLVALIHVKLGTADWHVGPLGCAKFHLNRHRGWECGPENIKYFHFLVVKSRTQGRLPWPISKIFTTIYRTLVSQISCDSNHRLRSYCWETARR